MATWEDGPEYAPRERPQYFADAPAAPLESAPPVVRPGAGAPALRPRFDQPVAAVAALENLVPPPPHDRDPNQPFDVVTASLTTDPTWGSAQRSPTEPLGSVAPGVAPVPGAPWPVLEQPSSASSGHPSPDPYSQPGPSPDPYAFPAPGTPEWFAPRPTPYGEQPSPGRVGARQVVEAATPGLCICLGIGGLIYPLAPIMLVVAVFLSTRVVVAQAAVRVAVRAAAAAVAFFAVVGLVRSAVEGTSWWGFVGLWSLVICWVLLGVLLLTVWQGLTRRTPPDRNPWG